MAVALSSECLRDNTWLINTTRVASVLGYVEGRQWRKANAPSPTLHAPHHGSHPLLPHSPPDPC